MSVWDISAVSNDELQLSADCTRRVSTLTNQDCSREIISELTNPRRTWWGGSWASELTATSRGRERVEEWHIFDMLHNHRTHQDEFASMTANKRRLLEGATRLWWVQNI